MTINRFSLAVGVSLFLLSFSAQAQPKLNVVGGTSLNFGDLYTGISHNHKVVFRNDGTDTLIVTNVSATCGCTGTLMSRDHIAPGDSGVLSINFNPSKFGGAVEKAVSFDVNDTTKGHVRIVFKANVVKALDVHPDYVIFKTNPDSNGTESVTIKNLSQSTIRILSVTPSSDAVRVTLPTKTLEPGQETSIDLTFTPKTIGAVKGTLVIKTDEAHVPVIDVRYFALVTAKSSRTAASTDQK